MGPVKRWLREIEVPLGKIDDFGDEVERGVITHYLPRQQANLHYFQRLFAWLPSGRGGSSSRVRLSINLPISIPLHPFTRFFSCTATAAGTAEMNSRINVARSPYRSASSSWYAPFTDNKPRCDFTCELPVVSISGASPRGKEATASALAGLEFHWTHENLHHTPSIGGAMPKRWKSWMRIFSTSRKPGSRGLNIVLSP